MKTMNRLTTIGTELFELFGQSIDARRHEAISSCLECGEEGIAVDCILEWAIEANVAIPESYWSDLVDYFQNTQTPIGLGVKRLLTQVKHAA